MNKTGFSDSVKQDIFQSQNGFCKNCLNPAHSCHHKLPQNKANRAKYGLFIDSPMNGVFLCFSCHSSKAHKYKITEQEAEVYEDYLRSLLNDTVF